MWRRASQVLLGLSLTACAAATNPGSNPVTVDRSRFGNASRDILTAAEIVASRVTDAYQAVSQLRPDFLKRRGSARSSVMAPNTSVVVYLDELPYGGAEALHNIPLDRVRMIKYVSPVSANLRFGGSHPSGAILVTTLPPTR